MAGADRPSWGCGTPGPLRRLDVLSDSARSSKEDPVPTVVYRLPDGSTSSIEVPAGRTVMDGSVRNNLPGIVAECGGSCSCATCHVYLEDESAVAFAEPSAEERDLLEYLDGARPCSRLACQLVLNTEMATITVTVASNDS
jgi:ferredoxin, 2Fe-2S